MTPAQIEQAKHAAMAVNLKPEHDVSLQSMGAGLLRPRLPDDHADVLISQGLARRTVGGLSLTDAGAYRLASK